jgi:hypothetical protein
MAHVRHAFACAIALALLCVSVVESGAGNCSQLHSAVKLTSPSGGTVLENHGAWGTLSSAINGVTQEDSFIVNITMLGLAERNRTYATRTCLTPTGPGTHYDYEFDSKGRHYAPLFRFFDANDHNCYAYRATKTINGATIEGLYMRMTSPVYPDLDVLFSYEFADKEVQVFPNNDTAHTSGRQYSYHWMYDHILKFGLKYFCARL